MRGVTNLVVRMIEDISLSITFEVGLGASSCIMVPTDLSRSYPHGISEEPHKA